MCKTLDLKLIRVWVICFVVGFFFSFNYLLFGFFICFSVKLVILNFFFFIIVWVLKAGIVRVSVTSHLDKPTDQYF